MTASARWRRLDLPGMDAASLFPAPDGHIMVGSARYQDHAGPVALDYEIHVDTGWMTHFASISGTTPDGPLSFEVRANEDRTWTFNDQAVAAVSGCIDIDLGFTPATNLLSIRRLALPVGEWAEVTVAWIPSLAGSLAPLRQIYRRIAEDQFQYSCPDIPFETTLKVAASGFVRDYPPLWEERRVTELYRGSAPPHVL